MPISKQPHVLFGATWLSSRCMYETNDKLENKLERSKHKQKSYCVEYKTTVTQNIVNIKTSWNADNVQ